MLRIADLKPGDSVMGWMRIGKALKRGRNPDGSAFRYVPLMTSTGGGDDAQKFIGQVVSNSTSSLTITINLSKMDIRYGTTDRECLQARIPYTSLQRIRLVKQPQEAQPHHILSRTVPETVEVSLRW